MAEKFVSGLYREDEDATLSRRRLIDGLRDTEAVIEHVRNRRQFRGRYKSELTPPVRRAMRRATADLDVEPDGKLPL